MINRLINWASFFKLTGVTYVFKTLQNCLITQKSAKIFKFFSRVYLWVWSARGSRHFGPSALALLEKLSAACPKDQWE